MFRSCVRKETNGEIVQSMTFQDPMLAAEVGKFVERVIKYAKANDELVVLIDVG